MTHHMVCLQLRPWSEIHPVDEDMGASLCALLASSFHILCEGGASEGLRGASEGLKGPLRDSEEPWWALKGPWRALVG